MCALSPGFEEVSRLSLFGCKLIGRAGVCLWYVELCERLYILYKYVARLIHIDVLRKILKSRRLFYVRSATRITCKNIMLFSCSIIVYICGSDICNNQRPSL